MISPEQNFSTKFDHVEQIILMLPALQTSRSCCEVEIFWGWSIFFSTGAGLFLIDQEP